MKDHGAAALDIIDKPLADLVSERYLAYALSTITARSLPDVRDGLKPVHRRVLFAMRALQLSSTTMPKKSARVVGDVIGKFHPHGDQSVYDALVRLAQDFAQRYPLVDGQGNFGSIDGDNAAAMRYTEARLTAYAERLLDGLDADTVDFKATYDGEGEEPIVLPAAVPNLLANGSSGIAVGMATSIPPHNLAELSHMLCALIDRPNATTQELMRHVPGPDFPTGGILVEPPDSILAAYETGRGSFRLRARWEVEKLANGTWQIVITQVPYGVQTGRLIEQLANLVETKKIAMLEDIRDEIAETLRIVIVPKSRNVEPELLMEALFKFSDLEVRVPLNMNVLDGGRVPKVMGLKQVGQAWLDHRMEVLVRRSRHRLAAIERRLDILAGLLIAYLNLDEVIAIIRNEDEPKPALIKRFNLTDTQAEAILNTRLRQLRKLEEMEIRRENETLIAEKSALVGLLADEGKRWHTIRAEVAALATEFGPDGKLGARRTTLAAAPEPMEMPVEAMVEREALTILISEKGWVRAVKGTITDTSEFKYKEGDAERFVLHADTTDKLILAAADGRFYTLPGDKIPRGRGFGEPLSLMIDHAADVPLVACLKHSPGARLLLAADDGRGFQVEEAEVLAQTRAGRQVMTPADGARLCVVRPITGDSVAVIGSNRKLLVFPLEQLPALAKGRGVILQKYKDGRLSDVICITRADGLRWPMGERQRHETDLTAWAGDRAGAGRTAPLGFPRDNRFGG